MGGELDGRVVVVTGGGRGVGRAIAEAVAGAGAAVALVARSEGELGEVAETIRRTGGRAVPVRADVTSDEEVTAAMRAVERELGRIDVLVNNAGSAAALGPVWEVDPEAWWRDVEVNLRGAFLCCRAALPGMLERGEGRIVNVSTYAAIRPDPYRTAYASSKLAVLRLTDSLAAELAGSGVYAFAIAPGTVRTAMTARLEAVAAASDWPVDWPNATTRWLPPERAGELVVFLASGRGDALAGRFLHVLDDVAGLAAHPEAVERDDSYAVRLRKPKGR